MPICLGELGNGEPVNVHNLHCLFPLCAMPARPLFVHITGIHAVPMTSVLTACCPLGIRCWFLISRGNHSPAKAKSPTGSKGVVEPTLGLLLCYNINDKAATEPFGTKTKSTVKDRRRDTAFCELKWPMVPASTNQTCKSSASLLKASG